MLNYPLLLAVFIFLSFNVEANNNDVKRKTFLAAEKQVWQADSASYLKLYQQLNTYPLQPYLDLKRLTHRIRLSDANEIGAFLKKYRGSPLDWPLRKKWLTYLVKRQRKNLFLKFYQPSNNVELVCHYFQYQLAVGIPEIMILPKVTKLWLVGKSQPKACDPLFKHWQKAGYRTANVVWQRVKLAADGGKHTLLPYLSRLLPEKQQYLANLWHKVRRDPAYIAHLSRFPKKSAKEAEIMLYGLKRLIWRAPKRALRTYKQAKTYFKFTPRQQKKITKKFAIALASKSHRAAYIWLAKVDNEDLTDNLIQWRLAEALKQQNWSAIKVVLNQLPLTTHKSLQWQYWYARSLIATNEIIKGEKTLNKLALQRHYYGFLAASYLEKTINIQDKPLVFSVQEKQQLLENLAAKRAFELFSLKRFTLARREWNYWLSQLTDHEKLIAAKIANDKGWFDRSIFTLAQEGYLDDVALRFPIAFDKEIFQQAKKNVIDPSWTFAIARRESSFMSDAHSPAGALGLMQILPSTAKSLLHKKNMSNRYLFNVKNNIKLGSKYLKLLLAKQQGNFVLATASYNAGFYRVKAWLKNKAKLPADIWIETIPYRETRDYVKSVMAYQQIYQLRNGEKPVLFDQITAMKISE